jgi:DNA ligase-1
MLAQKAKNIAEAFEMVGKPCAVEYKYDGFRMLIHKKGNNVILFTRRLENVTKQFPEVADFVKKYVKGESFILDSEAVGFNKKTKVYTSFQDISQRIRRKYDIEKLQKELPVEINVFDIMYYNGKSLLDEPFEKRTELIKKIVHNHPYKIIYAKQIITGDEKKAQEFYKKALKDHQEGIMMKNLKAEYKPGRRVGHMLKIKPLEKELDLVITGAEYGSGKRSGWMSSFILSCKGNKKGEYLEIGKMGTGIKEKTSEIEGSMSFDELTKKLFPLIIEEKGKTVKIKPKIVLAVSYQEIQRSPNYESGFALRFPKFIALREDKPLSEFSDLKEVTKDFENQKRNWRYG